MRTHNASIATDTSRSGAPSPTPNPAPKATAELFEDVAAVIPGLPVRVALVFEGAGDVDVSVADTLAIDTCASAQA